MYISRISNKAIDLATGFKIDETLKAVLRMDAWSREEIDAYQAEAFKQLLSRIQGSFFYKEYLGCELSEFPIVDKSVLRKHYSGIIIPENKAYTEVSTSGTSGQPLKIPFSREMLLRKRVSHQKMLAWFDINRESKEIKIAGPEPSLKYKLYYLLRNKRQFSSFDLNPVRCRGLIQRYNRFKPEVLYGYPSSIASFLNYARSDNIELFAPRIVVTHAENLYQHIEEQIQEYFPRARLINQYWASEANIGVTCPHGRIHIDEDTTICELQNINDEGVGDLLITNLYSYALPFIRYKLGDRVKISNEYCSCGRASRVIEKIEGRSIDFLQLNNGKKIYYTGNSNYLAKFCENVGQYQVLYKQKTDELIFIYTLVDATKDIERGKIYKYFEASYGVDLQFSSCNDIPYEESGKFKVFKSV